MYLVINHNKTKYTEKYQLFEKPEDAVRVFDELQPEGYYSFPNDLRPGVLNLVDAGEDCNIGLINLEVK